MKKERYIVEIEMPDGDSASSIWVRDTLQSESDIEYEGRWKVSTVVMQNPDWDEWDEELDKARKDAFKVAFYHSGDPTFNDGWWAAIDYIQKKFLKPQNRWKPSDDQIKAIRLARSFVTDDFADNPTLSEILMELEKQLQKIKENYRIIKRNYMEVSREEMLEFAKLETFHIDDRLCPLSREDLRAESWLEGYEFAKRHSHKLDEEEVNSPYKD